MYSEDLNNMGTSPNLGVINVPYINVPTTSPAPSVPWWQKVANIADPLLNIGNKVIDTVQNAQGSGSGAQTTQQIQQQQQALDQQQKGNALKYVLIAVGVLGAGGLLTYALVNRKKKKGLSGVQETIDVPHTDLGDLNTAKTKAGKDKQRKAVFARLAAEGGSKPKAKKAKAKKVRI